MNATDYPILLVWSNEDNAFLARVLGLPGCIADGVTKDEAIANARLCIEEWLDAAQEIGRTIPPPLDDNTLHALTQAKSEDDAQRFNYAVQQQVKEALTQIVPQIAKSLSELLSQKTTLIHSQRLGGVDVSPRFYPHSLPSPMGEVCKR